MAVIDIIILVLLALAVIKGLKDGLIRQIGGIAGLFIGIILAGRFSSLLADWLGQWVNASENIVKIIAFILIININIPVIIVHRLILIGPEDIAQPSGV